MEIQKKARIAMKTASKFGFHRLATTTDRKSKEYFERRWVDCSHTARHLLASLSRSVRTFCHFPDFCKCLAYFFAPVYTSTVVIGFTRELNALNITAFVFHTFYLSFLSSSVCTIFIVIESNFKSKNKSSAAFRICMQWRKYGEKNEKLSLIFYLAYLE